MANNKFSGSLKNQSHFSYRIKNVVVRKTINKSNVPRNYRCCVFGFGCMFVPPSLVSLLHRLFRCYHGYMIRQYTLLNTKKYIYRINYCLVYWKMSTPGMWKRNELGNLQELLNMLSFG